MSESPFLLEQRAERARIIARTGYCAGCGSKIKRRLAGRHVIVCSVSHMNYATTKGLHLGHFFVGNPDRGEDRCQFIVAGHPCGKSEAEHLMEQHFNGTKTFVTENDL